MSFFAELKRRNVIRMAGLYLVGAWLAVQVFATLLPVFEAPPWVMKAIVATIVVGFVPMLIFAWIYELTPQGLKRDADAPSEQSIGQLTGRRPLSAIPGLRGTWTPARRIDFAIIAVLLVALGYFAIDKFVLAPRHTAGSETITVAATPSHGDRETKAPGPAQAADAAPIPDKSIAVLRFGNLSEEQANAFFADGIQDQILTGLAKIGDLKVISRTSTLRYASAPENLSAIARELGVAHILEGSVQKAGNRVRINVQLIRAASDSHLWAETYDRTLDDIFAVESEVAQKIADSLAAKLTSDERAALERKPTENAQAYAAYLKARAYSTIVDTQQAADQRLVAYRDAVAADPGFALAWAELSREASRTAWAGFDPTGTLFREAVAALDRARALAPDLPQAEMARGVYLYYSKYDYAGAYAIINGLKPELPGDADVWLYSGLLARRIGKWDESAADLAHAWTLTPNDPYIVYHLATTWYSMRRFDRALPLYDASLALKPGDPGTLGMKFLCLLARDGLAGAEREFAALPGDTPELLAQKALLALYRRDFAAAADLYWRALAAGTDLQIDVNLNGYLPAAVDWQLQYALAEQRAGASEKARELYEQARGRAQSALDGKPQNRNVEAGWHAVKAIALAGLGQRGAAEEEARVLVALIPEASDTLEGPTWADYQARVLAMNGNVGPALEQAAHLLATNSSYLSPAMLRVDPAWDPVRADPRFEPMLKQAEAAATDTSRRQP